MVLFGVTFLIVLLCVCVLFDVNYFTRHVLLMIMHYYRWKHSPRPLVAVDCARAMCRLSDIGHNWHMHNTKYLTAFEYGRSCFLLKNGLLDVARELKTMVLVSAVEVRYRIPVGLFQRYWILSQLVFCHGRDFFIDQKLVTEGDNLVRATCLTKLTMTSGTYHDVLEVLNVPPVTFADAPADVWQFMVQNMDSNESLNPEWGTLDAP